jgi:hypothetical protein
MEFETVNNTYFSLMYKGQLLELRIEATNDMCFCGTHSYAFCKSGHGDIVYKADTFYEASYAAKNSTPWYNSCPVRPTWPNKIPFKDVEIVEVKETIKVRTVDIPIPIFLGSDLHTCLQWKDKSLNVFIVTGENFSKEDLIENKVFKGWEVYQVIDVLDLECDLKTVGYKEYFPKGFAALVSKEDRV